MEISTVSITYREVHFLLGDWMDPSIRTVAEWCKCFESGSESPSMSGIYEVDIATSSGRAFERVRLPPRRSGQVRQRAVR